LIAKGITVDGGIRLGPTPSTAVKIASIQSPTLDRIISAMNRESINHFAELLLRNAARGKDRSKQGTVANSKSLLREFFADKVHADSASLQVADGSGLSTLDRVTSRGMVQMLGWLSVAASRASRRKRLREADLEAGTASSSLRTTARASLVSLAR
jgi:D-alanyl-D-alanine carboxypeptidase/D-alanyl-D-alanine-endopeptidase (penicillin-binding protein 4)